MYTSAATAHKLTQNLASRVDANLALAAVFRSLSSTDLPLLCSAAVVPDRTTRAADIRAAGGNISDTATLQALSYNDYGAVLDACKG